jgi:hypothetical protein
MEETEFNRIVAEVRTRHPQWFQLEREAPATASEVAELEEVLGVKLPSEYRNFVLTHGAGDFAKARILGLESGTGSQIAEHMLDELPDDFIPVLDNGVGDYYGFIAEGGVCRQTVSFWDHETGEVLDDQFNNFYEMVVTLAFGAESGKEALRRRAPDGPGRSGDKSVLEQIRIFEMKDDDSDYGALVELIANVEGTAEPRIAFRALFDLLERYPDADFGSPGPIVHFLEQFFRDGYEDQLIASVRRRPTSLTLWMLNRLVNGTSGAEQERYLDELRRIEAAGLGELSDEASRYVGLHDGG